MKSLDPRVNRITSLEVSDSPYQKNPLDQLGTFEVFVQPKEGKPFQHEGAVHAPDRELAFILAKESFTRRFTCVSLYVVRTNKVFVSPMTENAENAYDLITKVSKNSDAKESFEIFHLYKRGKQHVHAGTVRANSPEQAMLVAKVEIPAAKTVYNIWAVKTSDIRFTLPEEKDLWLTLPDKKFRDASDYRGGDKLKEFLSRQK